jgi:uncharacterized protein
MTRPIPTPPRGRAHALATVTAASLLFAVIVVLFNLAGKALLSDLVASGIRARTTVELTSVMLGEVVLLVAFVRYLGRRGMGLRQLGLWATSPARGWIVAVAVAGLFIWFNLALPLRNEPDIWKPSVFHFYNSLLAGVIAGVVEEIFFRGFLMSELASAGVGRTNQVAISAVLYGLVHSVWGLTSGMFTLQMMGSAVIGTAVFGACYAAVYLASRRSLMPVIVSHAAVDFVIEPWLFMLALTMAQAA